MPRKYLVLGVLLISAFAFAEKHFQASLGCPASFSPSKNKNCRMGLRGNYAWYGTVTVRNAEGALVKVIATGVAGEEDVPRTITWDGTDFSEKPVPAGRYTVHLGGNTAKPLHTWGEKKKNVQSFYIQHGIFDSKAESFFFQNEIAWNDTPFFQNCGAPVRVMRRFDLDGNPLGEMMYLSGASSATNMAFCVDIHNCIYFPGWRHFMDGMIQTFCKYDRDVNKLVWEVTCLRL